MATKTAAKVIAAWQNRYSLKCGNTETNGKSVFLFSNEIIRRDGDIVLIRTCGYPTVTTKDRLNALGDVHVFTRNKKIYLNGEVWENHEHWTDYRKI